MPSIQMRDQDNIQLVCIPITTVIWPMRDQTGRLSIWECCKTPLAGGGGGGDFFFLDGTSGTCLYTSEAGRNEKSKLGQ